MTFLFTDVEGSTRLLEQLGERYHDVQDQHTATLREGISAHGGSVVSTEGDSFFAVFPDAQGAVSAAVQAQRELAAKPWPAGVRLRVRMGLHTGAGILGGDNYLGLDVNRAARIAAAAYGEQVLISEATHSLIERCLPPATRLRGVGRHRFKNLTEPERLYQVVIDGLEQDFPPPRTLSARPNNLPTQLTAFIGRHHEVSRVRELLAVNRLLTLTGTGGTGKTRLALEVAEQSVEQLPDGVFFVDLSAIDEPELVPSAIAAALGVREDAGAVIDAIVDHLREKELLLVLDNFEQVVQGASAVLDPVLRSAPGVKTLVTSRVPLGLYGEQQFHVPPLELPDLRRLPDVSALAQLDAVTLFVERAVAVKPDFRLTDDNAAAVTEIILRVDGLPLAIELAASRVKLLPPERLLARLHERLALLTTTSRNVPERQRTLRGTIEWSYELLDPQQGRMFARLAVFTGGADLAAIEAIVSPNAELGIDTLDALTVLVESNLLRGVDAVDADPRFAMLETVREYGLERLAQSGEEPLIRRRHAEHWIDAGEQASDALSGPDQVTWSRRLELDHDNFRSALTWVLHSGEAELGLRLCAALKDFWRVSSHVREGVRWLTEVLAMPNAATNTLVRAKALSAAGDMHGWINDPDAFLRFAEEALAILRELGDLPELPDAIQNLGWAQLQTGRLEAAASKLSEARDLYLGQGDLQGAAHAAMGLGVLAVIQGRAADARPLYEEALQTFQDVGNTYYVGLVECMLAQCDRNEGKLDAAQARIRAGLSSYRAIKSTMGTGWALYQLADLALQRGQHARALRLVAVSDALLDEVNGEIPALVVATTGDVGQAARAGLDEATAERVYQEGRAMPYDDAVAYALQPDVATSMEPA
ncbi:MAG: AAA family ATPase [Actinomycetota bacterium]|nr:AAA family ATPase [Actinomycetota bacterium]